MPVFEIEKWRKWHYKPGSALDAGLHLLFPFWEYCLGVGLFVGKGSLHKWIDLWSVFASWFWITQNNLHNLTIEHIWNQKENVVWTSIIFQNAKET